MAEAVNETEAQKLGREEGERVAAFGRVLNDASICGPDGVASIVYAYVGATFKPR